MKYFFIFVAFLSFVDSGNSEKRFSTYDFPSYDRFCAPFEHNEKKPSTFFGFFTNVICYAGENSRKYKVKNPKITGPVLYVKTMNK